MDEFEFKPLSQGLGFQKSGPSQIEVDEKIKQKTATASILKAPLIPSSPPLRKRSGSIAEKPIRPRTELPPPIRIPSETERRRITPAPILQRSCPSMSSFVLDSIFVTAITLLFTIALLQVTHVSLMDVLFSMSADIMPKISMGVLFGSIFVNYLIVCRSFYNCTLGEWAFDMQLGNPTQIKSSVYPLRVTLRIFAVLITGVFFLPLLSLIFRRDIAGDITGIHLHKRSFEI